MGEDISITTMKKALKEAGIQDLNISQEELRDVYNVIKNSKNTAELDESRRQHSSLSDSEDMPEEIVTETPTEEQPSVSKTLKPDNEITVEQEESSDTKEVTKRLQSDETYKNAITYTFGFNDMPQCSEVHRFKYNKHTLQYTSVQNTPAFLKFDDQKKVKILYGYFAKMSKIKSTFTKNIFKFAPKPEPIKPKKCSADVEDFESNETYVCRSGRQTKKRNYCYDEDSLEATSLKRTKSQDEDEGEWLSKSNITKPEPKGKRNPKKVVNSTNDNNNESAEVNHNTSDVSNSVNSTEVKSTYKFVNVRKLTNPDIMKRSKLFQDSPRSPRNSSRTDILFDNLVNEEEKKRKEEEEMEKFKKTLDQETQENEVENNNENEEVIDVDYEPVIGRVVPPIPGRKAINGRTRKCATPYQPINVTVNKPKGKTANEENSQQCPICNKSFPSSQIQAHASSCGETDEPEPSTSPASRKNSKIMCELCDRVVPLNTDYEAHVKECLKLQQNKN